MDAEEQMILLVESLFPRKEDEKPESLISYNDFVADIVAPRVQGLDPLAAVADVVEVVQEELEKRFGQTVSFDYDSTLWESFLEKIGEDAELFLDDESDHESEEEIDLMESDDEDVVPVVAC